MSLATLDAEARPSSAAAPQATHAAAAPAPSHQPSPRPSPRASPPHMPARRSRLTARWSAALRDAALAAVALAAGVAFWHGATEQKLSLVVNFALIPGPLDVLQAFLRNAFDPTFHKHILVSLQRVAVSYAIAVAVGVVTGLLMGRIRAVRAVVAPYVEILRPIPAVAWIPLAILMWPTEESSIIFITFLGAVFPIILNTMHGVEQTPETLVRAARSLGASRLSVFWHVVLPAALPSIAAGFAIGMGVAWFSLLAGEIISGQFGIGYFTWDAYSMVRTPDIVVGMLMIGGLGSLSTWAVRVAMRPFLRWRERAR